MHHFVYQSFGPWRAGVLEAMQATLAWGANAASLHAPGRRARAVLDDAAAQLLALLGLQQHEIIFCGSPAEALGLAVWGSLAAPSRRRVLVGDALAMALAPIRPWLQRQGVQVQLCKRDAQGCYSAAQLQSWLTPEVGLVSLPWCSSQHAARQPAAALEAVCQKAGVAMHWDLGAVLGRLATPAAALQAPVLTLDVAPLGAPAGLGVVALRRDADLRPLWGGGGQFQGLRPGSEPVTCVAGLSAALAHVPRDLAAVARLQALGQQLRAGLQDVLTRQRGTAAWQLLAPLGAHCLPYVVECKLGGWTAAACVAAFLQQGVQVAAWEVAETAVCAPESAASPAECRVQFACGYGTTTEDVAAACAACDYLTGRC